MKTRIYVGLIVVCVLTACTSRPGTDQIGVGVDSSKATQSQGGAKELLDLPPLLRVEGDASFGNFLKHFPDDRPWEDWAYEPQRVLLWGGAVHSPDRANLAKVLADRFVEIPEEYEHFLSWGVLENSNKPWMVYHDKYPNPRSIFEVHAYGKLERQGYWLIGYFARNMKPSEQYTFKHAFALASYSKSGKPIDEHLWWWVEDDMYELWGDAGLANDTILFGEDHSETGRHLDVIYSKTTITSKGKFKTTLGDYPKPDPDREM